MLTKLSKIQTIHGEIDFTAMVHHCCLPLSTKEEFIIIGGGIPSFAFGNSFAKSYHIRLTTTAAGATTEVATTTPSKHHDILPNDLNNNKKNINLQLSSNANTNLVDVVYVKKQDAKAVRTALIVHNLMNKSYRMVPAKEGKCIAIPVLKKEALLLTDENSELSDLIVGIGKQPMPFSSSFMGQQKQQLI